MQKSNSLDLNASTIFCVDTFIDVDILGVRLIDEAKSLPAGGKIDKDIR